MVTAAAQSIIDEESLRAKATSVLARADRMVSAYREQGADPAALTSDKHSLEQTGFKQ